MFEPKVSRPYWPDALQDPPGDMTALKPWRWALERLEKSHNYWIATARPGGHAHLMLVWGIWWQDAFGLAPALARAKQRISSPVLTA
jgi:hypothetical protein